MGWGSGSSLAEGVWNEVKDYIPEDKKVTVATGLFDLFTGMDCDTMQETSLWDIVMTRCPNAVGKDTMDDPCWTEKCKLCDRTGWLRRIPENVPE